MRTTRLGLLLFLAGSLALAHKNDGKLPPIIDIHVHADEYRDVGPVCPFPDQFTASDEKLGNERQLGWAEQTCSSPLQSSRNSDEYMRGVVAEWERRAEVRAC